MLYVNMSPIYIGLGFAVYRLYALRAFASLMYVSIRS